MSHGLLLQAPAYEANEAMQVMQVMQAMPDTSAGVPSPAAQAQEPLAAAISSACGAAVFDLVRAFAALEAKVSTLSRLVQQLKTEDYTFSEAPTWAVG